MNGTRVQVVWLLLLGTVAMLGAGQPVAAGEPPLADAGLDQEVQRNATVLLDAAGSRDPDGTIRSYRWVIDTPDGRTIRPAEPGAARTSFVARQPGRYEVTVTVTDDDGNTASDTLYVDVAPGDATGDETQSAGSPDTGDTTPGLPDSTSPSSDGVTDPASPDAPLPGADAATSTSTAGGDGARPESCPANTTRIPEAGCLHEADPPASVEVSGPVYVQRGSVHTYRASVSDQPGGNERLTWSGGVSTGHSLTRMFTQPPGSTVTITATVEDGEGHTTTDSLVVHVVTGNQPPKVRIEGPTSTCVGEAVELEGYAIAAEEHDRVVDATWHDDPTFVPEHSGQYHVAFSARDKQAQTATAEHTVTVREERVCEPETAPESEESTIQQETVDKLLIRADDDNWVEGSRVSDLMRAGGNVPDSGAVEKIEDIGAALGVGAESTKEFASGNKETIVLTMTAENASKLGQRTRTMEPDETVAGADGPRINEHERLKNARVADPVETEQGEVKVVIRVGKNNEGNPDAYTDTEPAQDTNSNRTEGESPGDSADVAGSKTDTPDERVDEPGSEADLSSKSDQTTTLDKQSVTDTVDEVEDTITDAVSETTNMGVNLLPGDEDESESPGKSEDSREETDGSGGTSDSAATGDSSAGTSTSSDDVTSSGSDSDSSTSTGATVPGLGGIVDTASPDTDGVGGDSSGNSSSSSSHSESDPGIDGSDAWEGIV